MKVAIIGTRGIPNFHGGFEQFAEHLSFFLAQKGHEVYVYNSHTHPYQEGEWKGAKIVHCYDPENRLGTPGQFIYDWNCIRDARKRGFDLILQLGYTSSSIWGWFLPRSPVVVTNRDGLEWKRSKYSRPVQRFLKIAERWAVKRSNFLIADSIGIQDYLRNQYKVTSEYIPYGAELFLAPEPAVPRQYGFEPFKYNMLIARLEPENNIEMILDGVVSSDSGNPFMVVGKKDTKYGNYLMQKYGSTPNIHFLGGIYNQNDLNNLRFYSNLYFHGHSVGGTNPSLLEAMASGALIAAHRNVFNMSILGGEAFYFENPEDVCKHLEINKEDCKEMVESNTSKIVASYSWGLINARYESYLQSCLKGQKRAL